MVISKFGHATRGLIVTWVDWGGGLSKMTCDIAISLIRHATSGPAPHPSSHPLIVAMLPSLAEHIPHMAYGLINTTN